MTQHRSQALILGERLRNVRLEFFGEHGAPELARQLGLPTRTLLNYEAGVTVPGGVILRVILLCHVEPAWLATGQGPRYRDHLG